MPDIEGVPYEATGGKVDQSTAQALAARHREAASAGVGAASAAVAPVQAQVSALSSRVDSQDAKTLADAKAYTDGKVSGFATTAAMQAGDALTLSNAKAYTDQKVSPLATVASVTAGDQKALADAKAYTDEQVADLDPLPTGGTAGQVLTKTSAGEVWADPAATSDIKIGGTQPASGWWLDSGNVYVPPTPDTVAPVAGTLAVTTTSSKATLTVSGASDDRALNAAPYSFSKDNGITWGGWQSAPTFEFTGLASGATFTFRHRVRDAEGNVTLGAGVAKATAEQVSAYRDAVLALAPTDYFPMDDPAIGPTGNHLRNIGNATTKAEVSSYAGATVGAAGIGDGATSVSLASGRVTVNQTALAGATKFALNAIVDIASANGSLLGLGWDTLDAQVTAGAGATPKLTVWADSKNLNVATPATLTGKHMLTFSYDGTNVSFFWDGQKLGQAAPTNWTNGYPSKNTEVKGTDIRAAGLAFFRGKTLTDAQVQSLYAALPAA